MFSFLSLQFFYESVSKVLIPWHHATQLYFGTIIKLPFFFLEEIQTPNLESLSGGCHSTVSMVMSNTMHLYNS